MSGLSFIKMHGLGNDFVVLDGRGDLRARELTDRQTRFIADRHTGIGCDQLVILEPPRDTRADVFMRLRNADGVEIAACGNATRCVAFLLMREKNAVRAVIQTAAGLLTAGAMQSDDIDVPVVAVDMGRPRFHWSEIPVAIEVDHLHLGLSLGPLVDPVGVSMGNPHAVFFVEDANAIDLATLGPMLETDPLFPQRANIEVVQVLNQERLRMRVWERGTGITQACGTGACAALVASALRGLTGRKAEVVLDGGSLFIEWCEDDHVLMCGPVATSFTGIIDPSLLR